MNTSRLRVSRASSAAATICLVAGSLLATTALAVPANPAPLAPGQTSVSVPLWGTTASNYTVTPMGTGLAYCISGTCSAGSLSGSAILPLLTGSGAFLEVAGTTNLNPFGSNDITLAFAFSGSAADGVLSVALPGFSTYSTDVQACDPSVSALLPCPPSGSGANAARDSSGNITFSATANTGLPVNPLLVGDATDVYAIYTNAPISALIDPTVTITYVTGGTSSFNGLSLMPPSSSVPEPATLALLAAGLASLGLVFSLRRGARS
jgi:PEP-CTERM motif